MRRFRFFYFNLRADSTLFLISSNQATLPDFELRSETLKKEREELESAWKLAAVASPPLSSGGVTESPLSDIAVGSAENDNIVGGVSAISASDASTASAPDAAVVSDAVPVATESKKPQELLDLEDSCKEAEDAKRSHQRQDALLCFSSLLIFSCPSQADFGARKRSAEFRLHFVSCFGRQCDLARTL